MMAVHELGHVIHAALSGGRVAAVYFHPWDLSRTDLSVNPHPQFVAWGGPIWGCLIPLAIFSLLVLLRLPGRRATAAFAGFCLIANGGYIGAGWAIGAGDAGTLLRQGASEAAMMAFGFAAILTGLSIWHRLGIPNVAADGASDPMPGNVSIVDGDLLDQDVEVIVNTWNRNLFPWWLLLPQGVSRAIKRRAGLAPFRELGRMGLIPLGGAVVTTAGRMQFRAIIHVAGIDLLWRTSQKAIRGSVHSAIRLARERGYRSVAFPIIGSGSGGGWRAAALAIMINALREVEFDGEVRIVRYRRPTRSSLK